jgi:murein L,D-transpeptidase YcbB/YkuD
MSEKTVFKSGIKVLLAISTIASTAFFISPDPAMAQMLEAKSLFSSFYKKTIPEDDALLQLLKAGRIGDAPLDYADEIRAFYQAREYDPLWTGALAPYARTRQLIAAIRESSTHGLNPERYHLQEITDRMGERDRVLKAELELYLTDAAIKYARDMSGQRLKGKPLKGEISNLREGVTPLQILDMFAVRSDAQKMLADLLPKSSTYKRLREAYIDLSSKAEENYVQYLPLNFGGIMRPGLRHKNIQGLRARLDAKQQTNDALLYDDALFAAVMKFQREEGLKDDGIIGLDTLAALNRTNKDRLMQLRVNMERLRWMEGQPRPDKFIVVNIPAATLWAVEQGEVKFEMPVIVGRPERETPALVTDIRGVRFNPDWTVPPTIKKEDILPKLREDPYYLTNKGIELTYRGEYGVETLDPAAVDWERVSTADLHVLNMVQLPGVANPLGRVRVLMENPYSIYLHDTNQKEYFDKYARALSSGCIRMKEPLKVAEFIMSGEKGWDIGKIASVIAAGKTSDRLITKKIPVYILYYTVWIDDQGRVVFGRDIYNHDKALADALAKVDGVPLAGHNDIIANMPREKLVSLGEGG